MGCDSTAPKGAPVRYWGVFLVARVFWSIVRMANVGVRMQNIGGFGPEGVGLLSSTRVPHIGVRMQNIGAFWPRGCFVLL